MEQTITTMGIRELTNEYREMLSYGYVMGFGTRTFWKLTEKYECPPEELWIHLSLNEKVLLWSVDHEIVSDDEACERIVVVEF